MHIARLLRFHFVGMLPSATLIPCECASLHAHVHPCARVCAARAHVPLAVATTRMSIGLMLRLLRWQPYHLNLIAFFEFDLLDMLLCRPRLGHFHTVHHEVVGRNFSIFGIIPDSVCKAVARLLIPKGDREQRSK